MTAPTPAERAQAKRLAYLHPGFSPGRVNAIAQALADVREPHEALNAEIERLLGFYPSPQEVADAFRFRNEHVGINCKHGHHTKTADLLGHPDDEDFRCAHCLVRGMS